MIGVPHASAFGLKVTVIWIDCVLGNKAIFYEYYGEARTMIDASDDFDALFDQVSAQRNQAAPAAVAPAAPPPAVADIDEDDFDALFDQVASQQASATPAPAPAPVSAPVAASVPAGAVDEEERSEVSSEVSAIDKPMYERLGGIVRLLHDSLVELGYDKALTEASTQIVDAQDRLYYVATLTEQAANKVLNTLDEGMPAQDVLSKRAKEMDIRWANLFAGKLSIAEFKSLAGDSQQFAMFVTDSTEKEKARLLEIMMAQDFQDITGQLIKKVVAITKTVEHELAELLRDNAPPAVRDKIHKPVQLMQGPSVPSVALDQDNVDDLLADLGF
jgi:chemotaxis protein CheZ